MGLRLESCEEAIPACFLFCCFALHPCADVLPVARVPCASVFPFLSARTYCLLLVFRLLPRFPSLLRGRVAWSVRFVEHS